MKHYKYKHGYFLAFAALVLILSPQSLQGTATGHDSSPQAEEERLQEASADAEPPDPSKELSNLALLHKSRGEYGKAVNLLKQALAAEEKAFGLEHFRVAVRLNSLALLYQDMGIFEEALPLYERALRIDEKAYGKSHPAVARDLANLAGVHYAAGAYDQAQPLYERALGIDREAYGSEHPAVAQDLSNLAGLYFALGDYAGAKLFYERALVIDETSYGSRHAAVVNDLNNLAEVYRALGDYARAVSLYHKSLTSSEGVYPPDHPAMAPIFNNLAALYTDTGRYEKAEPLFRRALSIYNAAHGHEHPLVATVLNNLAGLNYALAKYDDAQSLYEQALSIDEGLFGEGHPRVAIRLNNLAEIYCTRGQMDKAREFYANALGVAEISGQPEILWKVQCNLAYLLLKQRNPSAAIFFGKEAVNTIQGMRSGISSVEKDLQKSFLKTKWHVYAFLADLLIDCGRLPEASQVLDMQKEEEYYDFLCRENGADAARTTMATYTDDELNLSEDLKVKSLRVAALGREYAVLKQKKMLGLDSREEERYKQIERNLDTTRKDFSDSVDKMIASSHTAAANTRDSATDEAPDTLEKMEGLLRELGHGAVAIHYLITDDKLRIILTTAGKQLERDFLIPSDELNRKIMGFRKALENPRIATLAESRNLYDIIIAPIDADLREAGAQTLMLNLYGALRYLPVAALHDGKGYLVERYLVAVSTPAAKPVMSSKPKKEWLVGGLGMSHSIRDFQPLPYVPAELESIVRHGTSDKDGVLPGVIYLDNAFTRQAFESVLLQRFPVIHIASHFELKPGTKKSSYLLLGDGTTLSLADIRDRKYDFTGVDMLTLSACNTAVSASATNGSEVESFGALAQNQGAKGVLATLWQVGDQSTCLLMQNFYRIRAENPGITKAEALNRAQLMFIRGELLAANTQDTRRGMRVSSPGDKEGPGPAAGDSPIAYSHPFFWAPFILMGNWL